MFQRTLQHIVLASSIILTSNTFSCFAKHSKPKFLKYAKYSITNASKDVKLNSKFYSSVRANIKQTQYHLAKQGVQQLTYKSSTMDPSKEEQLDFHFTQSARGMKTLDKSVFNTKIILPCLIVEPVGMHKIMYMIKQFQLKRKLLNHMFDYDRALFVSKDPNTNSVTIPDKETSTNTVDESENKHNDKKKVILLNPKLVNKFEDFGTENIELLKGAKILPENFAHVEVPMTYDNFSAEEILKAILPEDVMLSSFTQVGHIVQCNLREELRDYRQIVGQVLLDKIPTCETVVNKAHNIDNTYRNFQMELLAGKDDMIATHRENGCVFKMNFGKVYWNSRLSTEHARVVNDIQKGDLVLDVFAGIGPFSIPAAKRGAIVYANDLNPESHAWLQVSRKLNKQCLAAPFTTSMKDAADFLQNDARAALTEWTRTNTNPLAKVRILMNLPAKAIEFVKHVKMLKRDEYRKLAHEPLLYLYCFLPKMILETKERIPKTRAAKDLLEEHGIEFDEKTMRVDFVRNVAPNKDMYKILMKLGENMMVNEKREREEEGGDVEGGKKMKSERDGSEGETDAR